MNAWRVAVALGVIIWGYVSVSEAAAGHGGHWGRYCYHRGHCCHGNHCCRGTGEKESRRLDDMRSDRSLPMVLPIIETAPVFASPVALASQRMLVAPQTQLRAAVLRSDDVCASQERLERLEQKVSDIADSFDDLKEVVLQQARILDEISKRLPKP